MKFLWFVMILAAASLTAAPAEVAGTSQESIAGAWKVWFAGPGQAPKTVSVIGLDLKLDGGRVTGVVRIGSWPGEAPVTEGKIEGDRITFTATGHLDSTTGIPTCKFDVTVRGDEMPLSMTAIENPGGPLGRGVSYRYTGHRMGE